KISNIEKTEIRKKYNIPLDTVIYISVGRQNKAKNPLFAIDKFSQISNNSDNAFLILIGDGLLFQDVQGYLGSKGLTERSLLIRNIPFESISELYGISTYFISGCREEKFGLVALEALACGCRPLLPRSGAFPELYPSPEFFYEPVVNAWGDDSSFQKKRLEILSSLKWTKSIS
ncbi:TPA: glycosyltransferase, partial [Vibrio campbellii]